MVRIGVCGAAGRMGKTILELCDKNDSLEIGAAIEHPQSPMLGLDAGILAGIGEKGVLIVDDINNVSDDFDVLIDFTLPDATIENLKKCQAAGKRMVIGTTGFSDEQKTEIEQVSKDCALVFAPNMSIGVNLCFKLIELAAQIVGDSTDIEIIEAHHNQKKDAPSGTAVRMGEIVADTLDRNLKECAVYGRQGIGEARDPKTIGFETIRAGDIVGDHTVMFASAGERIEITHKASSRSTFASGALRAANWLSHKEPGLYDMQDVLGL
ncbi:MAG: 4-hydroxy-tetrahydrodipicolinate reductase [Gammaproteobacteria bacterium]|nr:4-hydroxy-tetrahydrodipicolinate reductase [Gammaproteobacteria bacterium]